MTRSLVQPQCVWLFVPQCLVAARVEAYARPRPRDWPSASSQPGGIVETDSYSSNAREQGNDAPSPYARPTRRAPPCTTSESVFGIEDPVDQDEPLTVELPQDLLDT
jgi:hypothetical protein